MGSGSSKAKSLAARESPDLSPRKPVANVNKPELSSPTTDRAAINSTNNNNYDINCVEEKQGRIAEGASKLSLHENRIKKDTKTSGYNITESSRAQQFDEDSDFDDDDIDTILQIPVAIGKSKQGGNKQKIIKQAQSDRIIGTGEIYNVSGTTVPGYADVPLPETYAQRMQRQQYTLQQNVVLRDKEVVKSAPGWRQESDDEEDGKLQTGFDASKYRAVNRGSGFMTDVYTSGSQGVKTQHDLHKSTGHYLDDLGLNTQENMSVVKQLPQYNQSELDLMRQLEDDLL
ncbi:unnamed protein product [Candidula unifasciata]|uniref:Uncharacterized protein n=1 Tax=Candidula unifasciata TaxID=100452 RepID=A0A8S3Z142_9EUPU|nr:unnamed protein product [Candidula unifasciata]